MCFIALWRTKLKSSADSESPCLTPDDTVMDLVSWFPTTTIACDILSVILTNFINLFGTPKDS
jgi:hypothetical protein